MMDQTTAQKVLNHPEFKAMARQKSLWGWSFSFLMFGIYAVYILYIGMSPESFGIPAYEGATTTWGIYYGIFVILFAVLITGIYVHRANGHFEKITQKVVHDIQEGPQS